MLILVTGAAGLLGRRVVAELAVQGHAVRAGVRKPAPAAERAAWGWPDSVVQQPCDLADSAQLAFACAGVDAVIHLAFDMRAPAATQSETALAGTSRLVAAMAPGTRLLLASSFSVYDWDRVGAELDEGSPLLDDDTARAHDSYAGAKLRQEALARTLCAARGIGLTVLRPALIWSRRAEHLSAVGQAAGPLVLVVAPRRRLRLTHVDNCAAAFVAALDPRALGQTFNIDDGYPLSAWEHAGHGHRVRVALPYRAVAVLAGAAALVLKPLLGARLPGLLVPQRLRARFHPAVAGHAKLTATLGWRPLALAALPDRDG